MNRTFKTDLALTFIKASILTLIVLVALLSLSSCDRVADRGKTYSNEWRATVMKTGRHITVINQDSMLVMSGDTVTAFYSEGYNGTPSYYYIANTPDVACDTTSLEMYVDGKDTIYHHFESWNVVLEKRIAR
jgi:hypothetical protein